MSDNEIWDMGIEYVAIPRNQKLKGRGDLLTENINKTRVENSKKNKFLKVVSEPVEHSRHANIINYPTEKSKQKLLAMKLAEMSVLHLFE